MPASTNLPEGLWPVMLTPFTDNNAPDLEGLRRLTALYLDSGSAGLFANCLSSEMFQLTDEERLAITRTVIKEAGGRVPVVATGTFSHNTDENAGFIKKVADTGAAAVIMISSVLVTPQENDDVLKSRLEDIMAKTGDIPLGLYECPVPYKRLISPDMLVWLSKTGRFLYHKDTSCNSASIDRKVKAVKGSLFNLYNADTPTALDSLDSGASGISPIAGNFYPELYTHLLTKYRQAGRTPELDQYHALLTIMDRIVHVFYPYAAKLFLQKRGLKITTQTRIPYSAMNSDDLIRFHALYDVFSMLVKTHGIELAL